MYRQVRNRLDGFLGLNSWCMSHSCTVYFGFNTIDDISLWICRVLFWLRLVESATFGDGQHSWMTLVRVSCLVSLKMSNVRTVSTTCKQDQINQVNYLHWWKWFWKSHVISFSHSHMIFFLAQDAFFVLGLFSAKDTFDVFSMYVFFITILALVFVITYDILLSLIPDICRFFYTNKIFGE